MALSFRDASDADAPLLGAMNHRLIRDEAHRNRMSVAALVERMREWLSGGEYEASVIEADGRAVGYALYKREPDHIYLRQFYIAEGDRRQGIGSAAIAWLCENRWKGAGRVRLDVLVGNCDGREFWKAAGFAEYCVTMEREL